MYIGHYGLCKRCRDGVTCVACFGHVVVADGSCDQCAIACLSTTRYLAALTLNASRTNILTLFLYALCGILVYKYEKHFLKM